MKDRDDEGVCKKCEQAGLEKIASPNEHAFAQAQLGWHSEVHTFNPHWLL